MSIDEMIDVLQAAKDGKKIQCRYINDTGWLVAQNPTWNFLTCDYRVAPEPREIWVNECNGVLSMSGHACANVQPIKFREVMEGEK